MNFSSNEKNLKFFSNKNSMNGLVNFIAEMRTCRLRDLEKKRVNKELANIRYKFKNSGLNGYNKKKYVAKLMYMYILGYEIDFGYTEAVSLMSSTKYSEKHLGYLAVTLMMGEEHELYGSVTQAIKRDLEDPNETFNCLALHAVANIGGRDLYSSLVQEIFRKFTSRSLSSFVKKKAGLCVLRIYRKFPDLLPIKDWVHDIVNVMDEDNLGVVNAAVCLITALAQTYPDLTSGCVTKAIMKLNSIVVNGDFDQNYAYYKIPAPWLQVKLLRLLQYFPSPQNTEVINVLDKFIQFQLKSAGSSIKNYNQGNAVNAVLFELINYIIHLDPNSPSIKYAGDILGSFLSSKETNFRYLALETMAHIAATGDPLNTLAAHEKLIVGYLQDKDISVRRRALDLLYSMCNSDNYRTVVAELLAYLNGDSDREFQEELVLKIAILAEKYVSEYTWYVDVVLKLITTAGESASDSLWHRVVQIVTNHEDLREYAAYTILQAVKEPSCHEVTVCIAGHILGEFGHVIVESPGCTPLEQFMALHSKFGIFSSSTKAILLSTYIKFVNLFPEIQSEIVRVFESYQYVLDVELQQRACEYLAILQLDSDSLLPTICEEMPPFPERESTLINQLTDKFHDTEDVRTWTIGGFDAQKKITKKREHVEKSPSTNSNEPEKPVSPSSYAAQDPINVIPSITTEYTRPSQESIRSWYENLVISLSGVLYEDSLVQIGIKSEYQLNLGRLAIFFGNKTGSPLSDFTCHVQENEEVRITVMEEVASSIPASTQLHKMLSLEAVTIPSRLTPLEVSFKSEGRTVSLSLILPITATKFIGPCELDGNGFFARWQQIGTAKESQVTFNAPEIGVDLVVAKRVAAGLSLSVLGNVDPNPDNLVLAGIFSAEDLGKVGCLARIECNRERQMYRVTVRTTDEGVSAALSSQLVGSLSFIKN